jgi:hypothetical protein
MVQQPDDSNAPHGDMHPAKLAKTPESHTKHGSINITDIRHPPSRKLRDQNLCTTTEIYFSSRAVVSER